MRGAVRHFIEATTPYKVCDAVDDGVSAIHKAMEARCNLVLLNLSMPLQDTLVTAALLRNKLPHVKNVGFSASSVDLGNRVSPATGFDANQTRRTVETGRDSESAGARTTTGVTALREGPTLPPAPIQAVENSMF